MVEDGSSVGRAPGIVSDGRQGLMQSRDAARGRIAGSIASDGSVGALAAGTGSDPGRAERTRRVAAHICEQGGQSTCARLGEGTSCGAELAPQGLHAHSRLESAFASAAAPVRAFVTRPLRVPAGPWRPARSDAPAPRRTRLHARPDLGRACTRARAKCIAEPHRGVLTPDAASLPSTPSRTLRASGRSRPSRDNSSPRRARPAPRLSRAPLHRANGVRKLSPDSFAPASHTTPCSTATDTLPETHSWNLTDRQRAHLTGPVYASVRLWSTNVRCSVSKTPVLLTLPSHPS